MTLFIFISSGLFLGWTLGANDAANIFGTAVGTKMVKFRTAAIVASFFVVIGAVVSGAGAARSLGELGAVNEIAGSFIVALSAGITVYWMTKFELPVSTTQAIVGAIIGWNIFSGSLTDYASLSTILVTWVICPVLAAGFSITLYRSVKFVLRRKRIHLLKQDFYTRAGLIIIGAFGSYSLGANNIANVMGVFVDASPFRPIDLAAISISGTEQLFLLGGISIAAGVLTYSYKVMDTVGSKIVDLNPESALVAVLSTALVLFLFASQGLESFLAERNLPTIPLVPVSSSQAVVGAVIGIGLARGGRNIDMKVILRISSGWISTPVIAGAISLIALFFMQNVFNQKVYKQVNYEINSAVVSRLAKENLKSDIIRLNKGIVFKSESEMYKALTEADTLSREEAIKIIEYSRAIKTKPDDLRIRKLTEDGWFSESQINSLKAISGKTFDYPWQMQDALASLSDEWRYKPATKINREFNSDLKQKLNYLTRLFRVN